MILLNIDKLQKNLTRYKVYCDFLINENQKYNLTAIKDAGEIYEKHFLDSLAASKFIETDKEILDIGAGAGFPSVPLAIENESANFTLIDSVNKKVNFLNELIKKLELKNAAAFHTRIEDLNKNFSKNFLFDTVLARGVASLNTLTEYSMPFLKIGGRLIAYKSFDCQDEIKQAANALKLLNCALENEFEYELSSKIKRRLLVIKKLGETDKKYPRPKNLPRTKPL